MCDGWTESSRFLVFVHAQPSSTEWEARREASAERNWSKLLRPDEAIPSVAQNRCSRQWNGDVLLAVEEIVSHTPNADPYETKRPPAQLAQIRAMLEWAIGRGLKVQVMNGMTCHPGNDFNEHFTTVPLDLTPDQLAHLVVLDEATLRGELERLVAGRPTIRPNPMTKVA